MHIKPLFLSLFYGLLMRSYVLLLWEKINDSYWLVPALMAVAAVILLRVTLYLDASITQAGLPSSLSWLKMEHEGVARELLATSVSAIVTIISIVFSMSMVVLTLAASQYGPQVLRNFMKDGSTKSVLGIFIATFLYCLFVLRVIGAGSAPFIPSVSVFCALVLMVISVGMLVYFIHHIANRIQVSTVTSKLNDDLAKAVCRVFPERFGKGVSVDESRAYLDGRLDSEYPVQVALCVRKGGYIQAVAERLVQVMKDVDGVMETFHKPGDFVVKDEILAAVFVKTLPKAHQWESMERAFLIGDQRTPTQDVLYPTEELVSMAVRALSPGINEPFVAIRCVDFLSLSLCEMVRRTFPSPYHHDNHGHLRMIVPAESFQDVLERAFFHIIHYCGGNLDVVRAVLEAVKRICAASLNRECDEALMNHVDNLESSIRKHSFPAFQLQRIERDLATIRKFLRDKHAGCA